MMMGAYEDGISDGISDAMSGEEDEEIRKLATRGGDDLDKRWFKAVEQWGKQHEKMMEQGSVLTDWATNRPAWVAATEASFRTAVENYAVGMGAGDNKKRIQAIQLLEKTTGVVKEYGGHIVDEKKKKGIEWWKIGAGVVGTLLLGKYLIS